MYLSLSKDKPTLTSSKSKPVDGDSVTLTCVTDDTHVNKYQFFAAGHSLGPAQGHNSYTVRVVSSAQLTTYSCQVFDGSVTSDVSDQLSVSGKYGRNVSVA